MSGLTLRLKYGTPAQKISEYARSTFGELALHAQRVPIFCFGSVTTLSRPGDRTSPFHSNYHDISKGQFYLGIISVRGDSTKGTDPAYSWRAPINLESAVAKQLKELKGHDLEGAYPWIDSTDSLCSHLKEIYPHFEALPEDFVTMYRISLKK